MFMQDIKNTFNWVFTVLVISCVIARREERGGGDMVVQWQRCNVEYWAVTFGFWDGWPFICFVIIVQRLYIFSNWIFFYFYLSIVMLYLCCLYNPLYSAWTNLRLPLSYFFYIIVVIRCSLQCVVYLVFANDRRGIECSQSPKVIVININFTKIYFWIFEIHMQF